jgi:hypothetical protein
MNCVGNVYSAIPGVMVRARDRSNWTFPQMRECRIQFELLNGCFDMKWGEDCDNKLFVDRVCT